MQMQKILLTTQPHETIEDVPVSFKPRSLGKEDGNIYLYGEVNANMRMKGKIVVQCFETDQDINASGFTYLGSIDKDGKMYHFYGDLRVQTMYGESAPSR